jgi:hypothetical protein
MSTPRAFVQVLVGTALCLALAASAFFPIPEDLPAIALDQTGLYRLEVALAAFYGLLLLLTPAYSGLATGRLPIEISTRGAKFAEEADGSASVTRMEIEELRGTVNDLTESLAAAELKMERLQKAVPRQ